MTSAPVEPVQLQPRLDAKPWGGRRLARWGIALPPDELIGEALMTAPESVVASGEMAGASLAELAASAPERWIGARGIAMTGGQTAFPLLVKIIDAREHLSIQVHPDDRAAATRGLRTGKTEAHHILAAEPESRLFLGLQEAAAAAEFAQACRQGSGAAAALLRQVPSAPGLTVVVPGGTLHAIGAGNLVYEIQQPSDVTYRLDDWGRRDAAGRPRELHHEDGEAVLDPHARPEPIAPVPIQPGSHRRQLLAATRYFALERIAIAAGERLTLPAVDSPRVITAIAGSARLDAASARLPLATGQTIVVPVGTPASIVALPGAVLLCGWVPDLERDVIALARAAGATPAAIQALGIAVGHEQPPDDQPAIRQTDRALE